MTVADYGIAGMHLAYDLCDGYDRAILVDATPRGGEPGTVYVIEPEQPAEPQVSLFDAHGMQPDVVLGMIATLARQETVVQMLIVGCSRPAQARASG